MTIRVWSNQSYCPEHVYNGIQNLTNRTLKHFKIEISILSLIIGIHITMFFFNNAQNFSIYNIYKSFDQFHYTFIKVDIMQHNQE